MHWTISLPDGSRTNIAYQKVDTCLLFLCNLEQQGLVNIAESAGAGRHNLRDLDIRCEAKERQYIV